ncbi:MAG: HAD-IA family hydrolase [Actinomycetota bacterium]|nr:HAD-IA family hydrolase [Actinomycetota bacterium]
MRFRAIFFDAGETLVHAHPSFPQLFADVLAREGFPVGVEAVHAQLHHVSERFSQAARDQELWTTSPSRSRAFWLSVYERFLGGLGLPTDDGLHETLHREFTDLANYALFDDVLPVLGELRGDRTLLGVVSNFEEWLERLLEQLGVLEAFHVRVISGLEGIEKPDPRIYRLALERAGVDAADAAFVGDSPEFDVDPPAALGMFPVLIDRRDRYPTFSGVRIRRLTDLPGVLEAA